MIHRTGSLRLTFKAWITNIEDLLNILHKSNMLARILKGIALCLLSSALLNMPINVTFGMLQTNKTYKIILKNCFTSEYVISLKLGLTLFNRIRKSNCFR